MNNWSEPNHGVSHLLGLKKKFYINIDHLNRCSVALPGRAFHPTVTLHDTVEEAKAHGESQAAALQAFK